MQTEKQIFLTRKTLYEIMLLGVCLGPISAFSVSKTKLSRFLKSLWQFLSPSKTIIYFKENYTKKIIKKTIRRQFYWATIMRRTQIILSAILIVTFVISPIGIDQPRPVKAAVPVLLVGIIAIGGTIGGVSCIVSAAIDPGKSCTFSEFLASVILGAATPVAAVLLATYAHPVLAAAFGIVMTGDELTAGELTAPIVDWLSGIFDSIGNALWTAGQNGGEALKNVMDSHRQDIENGITPKINELNQAQGGQPSLPQYPSPQILSLLPTNDSTNYKSFTVYSDITSYPNNIQCTDDKGTPSDYSDDDASEVLYVEFEYSLNGSVWLPVPSPDSSDNKDWWGCNGWGLRFDVDQANITAKTQIYIRARALDAYEQQTGWMQSSTFWVDPRYLHDYGVSNIQLAPSSPNANQSVQVSATIQNLGASNESSVRVALYVDNQEHSSHYINALNSGVSTPTSFNWTATEGAHNFRIEAQLSGDNYPDNNSASKMLVIGTAPLLKVNGSTTPSAFAISATTAGTSGTFSVPVQNVGSAATSVSVSKGGTRSSWLSITNPSFNLGANNTITYNFSANIPASQPVGTQTAEIYFDWAGTRTILPIQFNISQFTQGNYTHNFSTSSGTIDGRSDSIYQPVMQLYKYLDNYSSTTDPTYLDGTFSFTGTTFDRALEACNWEVGGIENQESGSSGLDLSFNSSTISTKTSTFAATCFPIFSKLINGSNYWRIGLTNFSQNANNVKWEVERNTIYFSIIKGAWASSWAPGDSTVQAWRDGWDYGRICGTVGTVTTAGDTDLYNNGVKVATKSISSSDAGDEVCWTLSSSEVSGTNYYNLKPNGGTIFTISNMHFDVHYFTGQPSLQATRIVSPQSPQVGQNITVTISLYNNGSNIADNPEYVDTLPLGLQLVGGALSGGTADVDPGLTETASYTVNASSAGVYILPSSTIAYQDKANNDYQTTMPSTTIEFFGGTLQPAVGSIADGEVGSPIVIPATVTDSLSGGSVTNATVLANIIKPNSTTESIALLWSSTNNRYEANYYPSMAGQHQVTVSASKPYYTTGTSTSKQFNVIAPNNLPIARISVAPVKGPSPFTVTLDGRASIDVDGTITSYEWDIDNNGSIDATGSTSEWTLSTLGMHTIKLIVTDNKGATSSDTTTVEVVQPLPAPNNLSANAESGTSIRLSWQDMSSNETRFEVERSQNENTGWSVVGQVNSNVMTYLDSGLTCANQYFYRVRAYRSTDAAYSNYSNIVSAQTPSCPSNPPVITEGASTSVIMSQNGSPTPFSLTLHATDPDSATLTWSISTSASHGTATASGTGTSKAISYIPTTNYIGSDNFVVQVSDGSLTDTITVNVTINQPNNPTPTLSTISPTSATAGGAAFTLTVNGTNFISASKVRWNGSDRTTTYVSSTQLKASILASDITSQGTANVTVFNPTPGGGTSNQVSFTIIPPGSTCGNLLFSDDFSTSKGWIDQSNGYIVRDTTNQRLNWTSARSHPMRYYIPINAPSDCVQLKYRFNVTSASGNGGVYVGLIENLDAPGNIWGIDATGIFTGINRDTAYGYKMPLASLYSNGGFDGIDNQASTINYGGFNLWRKATLTVDHGNWSLVVTTDNGSPVGQMNGVLTGQHTAYNYLSVLFEVPTGWETEAGYLDDIEVYGSSNEKVNVYIGGALKGSYFLAPGQSTRQNYAGLDSGPVKVISTNGLPIISAIRSAWAVNGVTTSFSQLMGLPLEQLSDTYVFPGYNNVTLNDQLRIANVDTVPTTVTVTIGGTLRGTYPLAAGAAVRINYPGLDSGPVVVQGTSGVKIISSIREAWGVNGVTTSFVQLMGLPAGQLSNKYVFPAYNNVTLNEQLRIGNVDTVATSVTVTIGGTLRGTYPLGPGQAVRINYPGLDSGPVVVEGTAGVNIISSIRSAWAVNGVTTSFSQLMGMPAEQLSDKYLFPGYNNVTLNDQLRIANVDNVPTTVTVTIGGTLRGTYPLAAGAAVRINYPGLDSGPVVVQGTSGVKIISSIREAWAVNGVTQSFVQLMGLPAGQLSTTYFFPGYNNITLNEQIRIGMP